MEEMSCVEVAEGGVWKVEGEALAGWPSEDTDISSVVRPPKSSLNSLGKK